MNRRELSKNVAKLGLPAALALFVGLRKAEACWTDTQPVSACQSRRRTCCGLAECTDWSYYSHNNCVYYGKNPSCCG